LVAEEAEVARGHNEDRRLSVDDSDHLSRRGGVATEVSDGPSTNELICAWAVSRTGGLCVIRGADEAAAVCGGDWSRRGEDESNDTFVDFVAWYIVKQRRSHIDSCNGLCDALAVSTSVSGGPGADDEEFIGAGAVLSLGTEVDYGVLVAVIVPSNVWHSRGGVAACDMNHRLIGTVLRRHIVLDLDALDTFEEQRREERDGAAEEANNRK